MYFSQSIFIDFNLKRLGYSLEYNYINGWIGGSRVQDALLQHLDLRCEQVFASIHTCHLLLQYVVKKALTDPVVSPEAGAQLI